MKEGQKVKHGKKEEQEEADIILYTQKNLSKMNEK